MALLNSQQISRAGIAPTYQTIAAGGDSAKLSGTGDTNLFLIFINDDTVNSTTVTLVTPGTTEGQAVADVAVTIPASSTRFVGPINESLFGNVNNQVTFTYTGSGIALTRVGAFRL